MQDIPTLLEQPNTTVAVVGATDNPAKYGYVIYRDLKQKGYEVLPINPNRITVDGDKAFSSLLMLSFKPAIVNIVVPPSVTINILNTCYAIGLDNIWLQPGAESLESVDFLKKHGFNYLANACIMVKSRIVTR